MTTAPTPEHRKAYLALAGILEETLVDAREHSDRQGNHVWKWAAGQLLVAIQAIPVPEVAEDHAGQDALLEVTPDQGGLRFPGGAMLSTPVEPVEEVHYVGRFGGLHALPDVFAAKATDDPTKVTCALCLNLMMEP